MRKTNQKIERQLRKQLIRKVLVTASVAIIFIGFMSYALYTEYGPDAEIVDYFSR